MLGNMLKKARKDKRHTQEELAKILDVSPSAVGMYEQNRRIPEGEILFRISQYTNLSIDVLLGNINPIGTKRVPVLGKIAAGIPLEAITDIIDYEEIAEQMANAGEYFGLLIKGNSMEPRIRENDVVIVRKQSSVDSGEIAVVLVNGCDATLKKVTKQEDGILLTAFNPEVYAPKFYSNDQIDKLPVHILGKVVELRGKF